MLLCFCCYAASAPIHTQVTPVHVQFNFSSILFYPGFFFLGFVLFSFFFFAFPSPNPGTKSVLTFNTLNTSNALSRTFGRSWLERQFVFAGFWLTRLFIFAGLHAVVSSKSITFLHVRRVRSRIAFYLHTCCAQLGIVYTKN